MPMSAPSRRVPRTKQRMRSISSQGVQSSAGTVTDGSGSKSPRSGRGRSGHGLLLALLLASPSCLQRTLLSWDLGSSAL